MFCITFSADFTVWSETADFEGKDCTSYKDCTEVIEILQACCAQCWEVHSEGKPLFCYTLVNMPVAAMADQGIHSSWSFPVCTTTTFQTDTHL